MIVVDVLLGLNFLVLGACALRGQANRDKRTIPLEAEIGGQVRPGPERSGGAVILPFRARTPAPEFGRAMAAHPSAQSRAPEHS